MPRDRIHDLRHTAAALAIAAGAHPKAIQERLGHASITTTLDSYGHLFPAIDETLVDRLDAVARAASARDAGRMRDGDGTTVLELRPDAVESAR
jgi:integrase